MSSTDELVPVLKKLRLSGVLHTLPLRTRQAVDDALPFEEFLFRLLADEVDRRDAKQLESSKSFEEFDFTFNPKIPKARLIDLATATFVTRQENLCLVRPPGRGKTHLAIAIAYRAIQHGATALFTTAAEFIDDLSAASRDGRLRQTLARGSKHGVRTEATRPARAGRRSGRTARGPRGRLALTSAREVGYRFR